MDIELLHESMNAVPAVMRVVQAIDPISHAPIAQDVVESFIILLDQLGDDLVFFFRFWDISLQPLIISFSVKQISPFSSSEFPIVIMGNSSLSADLVRMQIPLLRPAA